jgi:hypothetical protein
MPFDGPPDTEFTAACATITAYVQHPESGWDRARCQRVREQIRAWDILLSDNERHAAHDAEKS